MRKLPLLLFAFLLSSQLAFAQSSGINFQGIARNASGEPLVNQKITLRFAVIQSTESGTVEYQETKEATSNGQGMFSVVIGDGVFLTKTGNFTDINWKLSPKFLKVELDPQGGTNFALMGTSRLQAVPFAYYANGVDAENVQGVLPPAKGGTGVASISALKGALQLDQVSNTSDANKPLSTATQMALASKVDKVQGKDLSTNDYTTAEKTKLAAITGTNTGDQDLSSYATIAALDEKANASNVTTALATKVDKVQGKDLSTNDYTTAEKNKLAAITGTNTGDQDLSGLATTTALATKANTTDVTAGLATKVDKVQGKDLSTNDYTTAEKTKLAAITGTNTGDQDLSSFATIAALATKASTNSVSSALELKENVANKSTAVDLGGTSPSDLLYPTQKAVKTYVAANASAGGIADGGISTIKLADGAVTDAKVANGISKTKVGLENVDNTSDAAKPISVAMQSALDTKANSTDVTSALATKVDKVQGKDLSTNDYTTAEKNKLAAISGTNTGDQDLSSYATTAALGAKANSTDVTSALATKVDKVQGKDLSTNDYTTAEKTKLAAITGTNTGDQDLSSYATTAALGAKANSTDVTSALATKVDKVQGKDLSTNDYTTAEKNKLAAITGTNTGDQDLSSYATTAALGAKANSTDVTSALATKVDKVQGKDLSTNDYTTAEKNKLAAISGTNTGDQINITGNAATATKLATPRTINGVSFDGSGDITIAANASAENLAGAYLKSSITGSSLTSVGVLTNATVNGKVIVGASSENSASAVLEANSTSQGFLPPRLTLAQRNAITNPAQGLMIYCTNCGTNGEPEYFNGTTWLNLAGNAAAKAIPTINLVVGNYTFSGSAQGPNSASNTGTGTSYTYSYVGTGSTTYAASSTRPTNAGTYSVTVTLGASTDGNYTSASATAAFTITKAIPTVTPSIGTYNYNLASPSAQGPSTATNTGTGNSYTYSYTGTGFTTYGPSATKPTDGGTYTVTATVGASSDGNYAAASSSPIAFKISLNLSLGNSYGGGKVAYILQAGDVGYDPAQQHGIIISGDLTASNTDILWGTEGVLIGASGGLNNLNQDGLSTFVELGAGINNTNLIVAAEGAGINYAAGLARAYTGGGYTNWYLPSYSELYAIRSNRSYIGTSNRLFYWTSTEGAGDAYNAWLIAIGGASNNFEGAKGFPNGGVKAVRVF